MRALMIVAALACSIAADAGAQPRPEARRPADNNAAAAAPYANPSSLQNACIISEIVSAPPSSFPPTNLTGYTHQFYFTNQGDTDTYRIDVTDGGLRMNSATQTPGSSGSQQADARFSVLIDTLRAAAAARARFRIDARNGRVTQVTVTWSQHC